MGRWSLTYREIERQKERQRKRKNEEKRQGQKKSYPLYSKTAFARPSALVTFCDSVFCVEQMVIEAAGGQLCKDKIGVTASTVLLAGADDYALFKRNKTNPWAPATEFQNMDFVKYSILRHKLDRETYKWK